MEAVIVVSFCRLGCCFRRGVHNGPAAVRTNHQRGAAASQIGLQFGHGAVGVQGHGAGPVRRRHQGEREFGAVGQHQRDAIAPPKPQLVQGGSKVVQHKAVNARVRDGSASVNRGQCGTGDAHLRGNGRAKGGELGQDTVADGLTANGTVGLEQVPTGGENGRFFIFLAVSAANTANIAAVVSVVVEFLRLGLFEQLGRLKRDQTAH